MRAGGARHRRRARDGRTRARECAEQKRAGRRACRNGGSDVRRSPLRWATGRAQDRSGSHFAARPERTGPSIGARRPGRALRAPGNDGDAARGIRAGRGPPSPPCGERATARPRGAGDAPREARGLAPREERSTTPSRQPQHRNARGQRGARARNGDPGGGKGEGGGQERGRGTPRGRSRSAAPAPPPARRPHRIELG